MYFIVIIYNAYFINYVCIYAVSLYAVYTCKRAGKPRFRSRYCIPRISSVRRTKSAVFQREFGQSRAVSAAFNLKLNSHRRRLHRRRALECSSWNTRDNASRCITRRKSRERCFLTRLHVSEKPKNRGTLYTTIYNCVNSVCVELSQMIYEIVSQTENYILIRILRSFMLGKKVRQIQKITFLQNFVILYFFVSHFSPCIRSIMKRKEFDVRIKFSTPKYEFFIVMWDFTPWKFHIFNVTNFICTYTHKDVEIFVTNCLSLRVGGSEFSKFNYTKFIFQKVKFKSH